MRLILAIAAAALVASACTNDYGDLRFPRHGLDGGATDAETDAAEDSTDGTSDDSTNDSADAGTDGASGEQ